MKLRCWKTSFPCVGLLAAALFPFWGGDALANGPTEVLSGELRIVTPDGGTAGACPLDHTEVEADIVGFVARTTVQQTFKNPLEEKIEAVYVFPLPHDAAVDRMVMIVGDTRITAQVKEREEAREIYEAARGAGHLAGLLDQERPNIFTQSVANIEPGMQVRIEISYVETLIYEDGIFEWVFPMVVGPRYIPGGGTASGPMTLGKPTGQVPDADRITPPVTPEDTRAGHDISLTVDLDPGMEVLELQSVLHEVDLELFGRTGTRVKLKDKKTLPNRDFILRYQVATDEVSHAFLTHHDDRGGFFTLVLQPPRRVQPRQAVPRELVFVLDTSGSMRGFPIDKAKEVIARMIDGLRENDTFNLVTFAGDTHVLWEEPQPGTPERRAEAHAFLASRKGGGGTEMMQAIETALYQTESRDCDPMRIVCFLTDGYVGNDMAIIDAVRRNAHTTRVFSFGVGNSVNRYLLDKMAHAGRGEVEYVTLASRADAAVDRFEERLLSPVLADIEIVWGSLPVAEVFPHRIPDLFAAKPIMVHGRLTGPADGTITLHGRTGLGSHEERIKLSSTQTTSDHDALASLWARAKIAYVMARDLESAQRGEFPEELKREVVALGVDFHLTTQFTSFVAVEEMIVTVAGEPRRISVPVEMPEGVSYEGVFGSSTHRRLSVFGLVAAPPPPPPASARPASKPKPRPIPPPKPSPEYAEETAQEPVAVTPAKASAKIAESLRRLARQVEKQGRDGNLKINEVVVVNYMVDVMILLRDLSPATFRDLQGLGFVRVSESKTTSLLIGRIDVRKLGELAALPAVIRVEPVPIGP
jgi:Ca-activated chloride channel family protein